MPDDRAATTDFEALFEHCAAITASLELNDLIKTTLAAAGELLPSDQVVLTIVEDGLIKVLAADPPVSLEIMENGLAIGRGLVGRAVAERTSIYSPDLSTDDRVEQTRQRWDSNDRSVVAVPLALGDQVIGALHAISQRVDAFSEQDRGRLIALAPAVAIAMRNALVLRSEREAWAHAHRLDHQKSVFMRMAAEGLKQPLNEVAELVGRLQGRAPDEMGEISHKLLDRAHRLAHQIEEVLALSLKESDEIALND
jgi:transcriptional regulator with GAF, ATPase, and Fis domain